MEWVNDDKQLLKLFKQLEILNSKEAQVGFFGTQYGADNDNLYVAQVAQWQEEGTSNGNIPERRMFRTYLYDKLKGAGYKTTISTQLRHVLNNTKTPTQAYQVLGAHAASELQDIIREGVPPANSPSTIASKGSATPLMDTGFMHDSVAHKVTNKI